MNTSKGWGKRRDGHPRREFRDRLHSLFKQSTEEYLFVYDCHGTKKDRSGIFG